MCGLVGDEIIHADAIDALVHEGWQVAPLNAGAQGAIVHPQELSRNLEADGFFGMRGWVHDARLSTTPLAHFGGSGKGIQ